MTDKSSNHINKLLIILWLFFSFGSIVIFGQENISGVINKYAKVNSVSPGYVVVDPAQANQFSPGDYVLLIQMQGVGIQTVDNSYGINVQSVLGTPGGYEFLIVLSVNGVSGRIDFTRNVFINTYDVAGNVQLVRVPFYDSPTVTATLVSQSWNSTTGTGGVLAMMVGKKLTMNADIDVTGQGFAGAQGVSGIGECVYTDVTANSHDSYPLSWDNAGLKGEGVAVHDYTGALLYPNHAKGQGRNFTGGGGGNGWFAGGGGGSNRGKGGDGGLEKFVLGMCGNDPHEGGYGGMNILGSVIQDGIFPGGGGGASTQATGSTASTGGNGGGIVIIVADSIDGNNHIIRSNGVTAENAVSDAGAGGGGAGGSVGISFQGFKTQLQISSNGGNGGTNPGGFGEGGGGGGGLIWLSSAAMPTSVSSATVAYGTPAPTIPAEGTGEIKYNYIPKLNGFLFNSIHTVATSNSTDSVCSNIVYGLITGTQPVGGTPPYTFEWQSSTTSETALDFATAPGTSNQQHYTPPSLLTQTTWFRRVVRDNGASITDISLPVMIEVHPYIINNVIGNPDTLCYGQNPSTLNPILTLQNGTGIYSYSWEISTDNTVFAGVPATTASYLPPAGLTQTTWYRRIVKSGSCVDTSASVRINVLDTVRNNSILTLPQEICQGMTFTNLTGTSTPTLGGGDNTYLYIWESSTDGSTWVTATGMSNGVNYDPNESAPYFPGQEYFRRVVLSGSNNVCKNISKPVLMSEYPVITNNLVTSDQTICSGLAPAQLAGSAPLNGKGTGSYTYTWQDSTKNHSWTDISGYISVTDQNFTPPILTDTTRYRRIVYSSACSDISKSIIINVHKPISNNSVSLLTGGLTDTTVCSGATPNRFVGTNAAGGTNLAGDYIYQWSSSPDNSSWTDITASGTGSDYQSPSLTATTWFRRRAASGQCSLESGIIKVTVLPGISNNTISGNQTVCKSDSPEPLTQASGASLSGGGGSGTYSFLWEQSTNGTAWIPALGTNNQMDGNYQPPVMTRIMQYRRTVNSGANNCCTSTSNVLELVLDSLPVGSSINAGPDTVIYSFDYIVQLAADPAISGGTGKWTVVEGSGSFEDDSDNETRVSELSKGSNTYLWTVTRGACKLEDQVNVTILDMLIPEGFSPNNDPEGYNNKFIVNGLDLPNQTAELTIINGAGAEVYYTSNRDGNEWNDWDGKNSKGVDLPEGTYYYLLKITSKGNAQVFKKSGFIVLKRY
jgi:hypothetical protein